MIDATLMELLKEVRWKTLKLLEGVDETQARFSGPGLNNSILWHAGHALIVVEHLGCMAIAGGQPQYPADWFDKFGWKSTPATVTSWPTVAEVVKQLTDQRTRLGGLIETQSQEQLDKIVGEAPRNRTLRGMVLHGLHDEAGHQGEMYLLKKLWKLKA
jgi:DinB superfamily